MDDQSPTVELRRVNVRRGHAASHARHQAVMHGMRLSALAGNTWPANDDGLSQFVVEEAHNELMSFAINARRYMELTGHKHLGIDGPLRQITTSDYRFEKNLWTAVNRIVHAAKIEFHCVTTPTTQKHTNLGDLVLVCAMVTSPQRDTIAVCPQGIFYGFAQSPALAASAY